MKQSTIGLIILVLIGIGSIGLCANKAVSPPATQTSVEGLVQQGPDLIARGEYKQLLSSISALPVQARNDIRVRCLECFANLAAWRDTRDEAIKKRWMGLRQKLIYAGDSEVTPLLIVLLKDKEPFVREYAAELLGYCGDKRALDALQSAGKEDDNRGVRKYAKWAHKQISEGLTPFTANLPALTAPRLEMPVAMAAAGPIATAKSVSFVNGTEDFNITCLGVVSGDIDIRNRYADLESWTDVVIEQLETELQKRGVKVIVPGGLDARRVVIGVLDMTQGLASRMEKNSMMEKLGQKPLVRFVDIGEYCSLVDLLKNGYEKARGYRDKYQVDMLLHIDRSGLVYYFSLIDLTARVMQTASLTTEMGSFGELTFEQLGRKVLADPYIYRVLRAKKKAAAMGKAPTAPAADLVFSIWLKDAAVAEGAVVGSCNGRVFVKQQNGVWSKTYIFNSTGTSLERVVNATPYRVVEQMLRDPAFRKALAP